MEKAISPEPVDITITSLGGLGDGIGTHNGKPVFVAKSCVGDHLRVRLLSENREGFQADIEAILTPGAGRRDAPCKYFSRCGGCSLQQLIPEAYRAFKTRMLHSALARAGYDTASEMIFLLPHTRRRVEFKVVGGKLAFFAPRSHTPVTVDECMILTPALAAMIAPINAALATLEWAGELFALGLTQADSGIDMMLIFRAGIPPLPPLELSGIARISVKQQGGVAQVIAQRFPVEMQLGGYNIALPPNAFLQATAEGQTLLTDAVLRGTEGAKNIVDLFCGIGTYSFPLSKNAYVHAVEGDGNMVAAIRACANPRIGAEQRDLFKNPLSSAELKRFDAAIINPPRIGGKSQTEQLADSGISRIVMVSCNPASFARDAGILKKNGFIIKEAQGIDQFIFSQHIEMVGMFVR